MNGNPSRPSLQRVHWRAATPRRLISSIPTKKTHKALRALGIKQFHNHYNPLGQYNSARTGKRKTCCYELYYINTHFLDGTRWWTWITWLFPVIVFIETSRHVIKVCVSINLSKIWKLHKWCRFIQCYGIFGYSLSILIFEEK